MKANRILIGTAALLGGATLIPLQEAAAQQTGAQAMLEEVVVTARRREESLAELPMSVVAITAEAMQTQGIYNTEDLGEFAANVTMTTPERWPRQDIFIRGIGGGRPTPLQLVGSGMYLDNHYLSGSMATYMSTVDIERVEVLRGPQGTLFGKNTTGGLINIISAKPGPEFESSLTLRAADFGQQDIRGMINVPLGDDVFGRFSLTSEQTDGYYFNRFLNSDVDHRDLKAFRGALRFTPGDNWTIDTAVDVSEQRNGQRGEQCQVRPTQAQLDALTAAGLDVSAYTAFSDGVPQWGGGAGHVERLYPGATLDYWSACDADNAAGEFVKSGEKIQYANIDTSSVLVSANWESNGPVGALEELSVSISSSWRDSEYPYLIEQDNTPLPLSTIGMGSEDPNSNAHFNVTRSFELIFNGQVSDRLEFVVGTHFFDEEHRIGNGNCWAKFEAAFAADPTLSSDIPCDQLGLFFERLPERQTPGGPPMFMQNVNVFGESSALFGHLTYALNDNWNFDLGMRYTEDERHLQIVEFQNSAGCEFLGPVLCQADTIMNAETVLEGGFFNDVSETFSDTTPMISLTRNLEGGDRLDSGMVYFTIAEGFLSGSFNDELNLFQNPELAPLVSYEPEHVRNYEVGFKGTLASGRLRLSGAVFWMDYTDKHEVIPIDNRDGRFGPGQDNFEITQNAASVDIYGIELELRATPWDGGYVTLDLGYLKNEYSDFNTVDLDNPDQTIDRSQQIIGDLTPDWTLNASVGHTFELANGATLSPMLGVYAQGGYEWLAGGLRSDPKSFCYQDVYTKWRARLTYEPPAGNWEASLFGSNIADERYYFDCDTGFSGTMTYTYGRPDAWGLEFVARWGQN
jgi:iron complex outermembrane receptor protein